MNLIASNILTTIFGGLFLAFLLFFLRVFIFREKNLSGVWKFEVKVEESSYNPFRDLLIEFQIHLVHKGNVIKGTGEKIKEVNKNDEVVVYERDKRVIVEIDGFYNRKYFKKSELKMHIKENGRYRESRTFYDLKVKNSNKIFGVFSSTSSDAKGKVHAERI